MNMRVGLNFNLMELAEVCNWDSTLMKVVCADPATKPQPKENCKYDIAQGKIVCDGPKPAKEICEWDNYTMKVVCRKVDEPKPVHPNDPPS